MSDDAAPSRYLVLGEMGATDGPFTVEELRQRLSTGRLRADDRLQDAATHAPLAMAQVVPDAAELQAKAKATASDRIRRRTSDRLVAVAERPAPIAVEPPAKAPGEESSLWKKVDGAKTPRPKKGFLIATIVGVLAIILLREAWDAFGGFASSMNLGSISGSWVIDDAACDAQTAAITEPGLQQSTTATLTRMRKLYPGLTMTINGDHLTISGEGARFEAVAVVAEAAPAFLAVSITPAHPQLGRYLVFGRNDQGINWYIDPIQLPLKAAAP